MSSNFELFKTQDITDGEKQKKTGGVGFLRTVKDKINRGMQFYFSCLQILFFLIRQVYPDATKNYLFLFNRNKEKKHKV